MNCSCPKCKSYITEEISSLPNEGVFLRCHSCNTNFNVKKESFARRALHKGDDISCVECGSKPGPSIYCQNCHAVYPDYYVTETTSVARKQLGKILAGLNAINRLGKSKEARHYQPEFAPSTASTKKAVKISAKSPQLAGIIALLLILIGGSAFYYYQQKIENEYMGKYVKALFVIKTSEDYNRKLCEKIAADWKTRQIASAPGLTPAEQTFLSRGVKDAESLMQKVQNPPKKFKASAEALTQLHEVYRKHQTLAASPTGTQENFVSASQKLDVEFRKSAAEMKAALPEKLIEKLEETKNKFKEMQGF